MAHGRTRLAVCLIGLASHFGAGCSREGFVDYVLASAMHPAVARSPRDAPEARARYQLLAGDLHCHVSPPDAPSDVTRGLPETADLARAEGLDFVVLTPHVAAGFFEDEAQRRGFLAEQSAMREAIDRLAAPPIFIPGFEYTDHVFGHAGGSFGDAASVLASLSAAEARRHPELFFERFVASGGVLTLNHPLVTPLASMFQMARVDLSWRPLTSSLVPSPEIAAIDRLAQGYEALNLVASQLRDRWLLLDGDASLRATLARIDRDVIRRGHRLSPFGGSDSHGHFLRATTFVLSQGRSAGAIREGLLAGRVCVRSPEACSFEARAPGAEWRALGAAFERVASIEVRAHGESIHVLRDGAVVASPDSDQVVTIDVPRDRCSVVRAAVDDGYSAPIYANCPFAEPR